MTENELSILQNGADIRGVATNGIIGEEVTLTTEKVNALGRGFTLWLHAKHPEIQDVSTIRIAIGMDCRLTNSEFADSLCDAITALGCDVLQCGLASTPAMLQSTIYDEVGADGAIMLTGSHMSFNRNGIKFFADGKEIDKAELTEIIHYAAHREPPTSDRIGEVHITNLIAIYSGKMRHTICNALADIAEDPHQPLAGLKIVVDAGNGAGGFFAHRVLHPLGADTSGSQFLTPDGRFPNHSPNPEDYEAMRSLITTVKLTEADLGIIFDADVDRVAIVDREGRAINRNEFVAMAAAIALEEHPHSDVVTDSITSTGLTTFIQDVLGSHQCRYQRGYRNVIREAIQKNENGTPCWLAVETSGHAAFKENNFCDDGAYFAMKVVVKLAQLKKQGKTLFSLIEKMPVATESSEFRIKINGDDFTRTAEETMAGLKQFAAQIPDWEEVNKNHEGLRVMCNGENEKGWFLFRLSLHSPVMPLNVESDVEGGVQNIVNKLKLFFRNVKSVDSNVLYK